MRQHDLPYATTPQMNLVRPTQRKKPSLFQKIVGKIKGEAPLPTQPLVQPPQAPGYNPYANVQGGQQAVTAAQGQARFTQPAPAAQPNGLRTQKVAGPPAGTVIQRPAAAAMPSPPAQAAQPRSITVSRPAGRGAPTVFPTPSAQSPQGSAFVQPGRAPEFLPRGSVAPAATPQNQVAQPAIPQPAAAPQPAATTQPDSDFPNPFTDTAEDADAAELLDLDSLISDPVEPQVPAKTVSEARIEAAETVTADTSDAPQETDVAEQPADDASDAEVENPFTGVQLNASDDEYFGGFEEAIPEQQEAPQIEQNSLNADASAEPELPSLAMPGDTADAASLPPAPIENEPIAAEPAAAASAAIQKSLPSQPATEQLHQLSERQRRERQRSLILSRSGQTGFKGFCPVELRDHRKLIDAEPEFTSAFGLQQYHFSSDQARAAFESDPSRYAPAAGGSDVVLLVNAGEEQPGSLDYAVWYRDRLYMFRSRETLSLFVATPQRFASQY